MMILKRREKMTAVVAAATLFILFWRYVVLQPIWNYENDLDADLRERNLKLYEAKKILTASSRGRVTKDLLQQFSSGGSPQEDMSRLIKEIETAANGSGLKVIETKPQPVIKNVGWFELKVNISFEGQWGDVVKFLYELENGPRPLLVNEMTLEANLPQQLTIRGRLEIGRLLVTKSSNF